MSDILYNAITTEVREIVPAKLVTITFCDFDDYEVFREFSTIPDAYPVMGRKPIDQTQSNWNDVIFKEQKCFLIERVRDYPEHFYDYEQIEALGLSSALCVPIIQDHPVHGRRTIGTVNLLDAEGSYTNAPLDTIKDIVGQLSSVYEEKLTSSKAG